MTPSLFDLPLPAANADPVTSHEAAAEMTKCGARAAQMAAVLAAVKAHPGRTSAELARISGIDRHAIARRLPDLERMRQVERGEARVCTASVKKLRAVTWMVVDSGESAA